MITILVKGCSAAATENLGSFIDALPQDLEVRIIIVDYLYKTDLGKISVVHKPDILLIHKDAMISNIDDAMDIVSKRIGCDARIVENWSDALAIIGERGRFDELQ